ncbi:aspartyl/glutamyl-tRNA amidotransferase subunit B [Williamsoniiplasma somnilux]|uniref:Aspartyl/glutamyl-tRNA(Asn/Gln) amidotransferase subunit B n=1 Tax=Williamsoniiplasma somnilux TaxID=215578 RepID=A0A2K8NZ35_9MOLU|nr:Asp-tRNA(Asn)/Glu-tRNA(Gln) amidotransferase subunit GatB [Williamsoniiplasma somnilux]ATZ18994.1 aspartyl/glutamyl-tRNA amidotransferase subunit B [Williamsoniiplasma somnilux]
MNNFEIIIGIENHVELKTKSKMFAPAPVVYGAKPNTMISEVDMGYPGAMPTVNKKGVELAILAAHAFKMEIDPLLKFDRKNYFYPDLVKGFQITQQFHPIGKNGSIEIELSNHQKKIINIERIHIEEDTAKQNHKGDLTYIDYNRSGVGLIEIVSHPEIRSAEEACAYVEKIREILLFLGVSDVKMNEGSLRCDVNVSIRPFGATTYSNRVEVKNLNSIANVKKAIDFEVARHSKILLSGEIVQQETRRFDENLQETVVMRSKEDSIDYRYFAEPNIAPIQLDLKWVANVIKNSPELAESKRARYINEYHISLVDTNIILSNLELTNFFEKTIKLTKSISKVVNYLVGDIQSELNKANKEIYETNLTPQNLAEMINLIEEGTISSKHAKTILPIIITSANKSPLMIAEELNLKVISDIPTITSYLNKIINDNLELIKQYDERPERVTKTIMGQLMKETGGNVNPDIAMNQIIRIIKNRR